MDGEARTKGPRVSSIRSGNEVIEPKHVLEVFRDARWGEVEKFNFEVEIPKSRTRKSAARDKSKQTALRESADRTKAGGGVASCKVHSRSRMRTRGGHGAKKKQREARNRGRTGHTAIYRDVGMARGNGRELRDETRRCSTDKSYESSDSESPSPSQNLRAKPVEGDSDSDVDIIEDDISRAAAVGTKRTVPTTVSDYAPGPRTYSQSLY